MHHAEQLAEIAVVVGAGVQPGQVVQVRADVAQLDLARAVVDAAYRHGARFVDLGLHDETLQRSMVVHGPAQGYAPPWRDAAFHGLDEVGGASVQLTGPTLPGLLDDLDPTLVQRSRPARSTAWREVEYRVNNTLIPGPNHGWARWLHPECPPDLALERLWEQIAVACRLHDPDPVAAWGARFSVLARRAAWLTQQRLDALALRGPGTDLTVGLLPGARWEPPTHRNERGIVHAWNLPSEEIYSSPDPARVDGHVRLTRPASVAGGQVPEARLAFADGRLVELEGGAGIERLRAFADRDAGTRRIGEIALVDRDSAVASVGRPLGAIVLDENAASHLALGFAYPELLPAGERHRANVSGEHLDLTIGSDEVEVDGVTTAGETVALLRGGAWVGG